MDGKEGMTSPEEDRISIIVDNPSTGSSERFGTGIDEEDSSLPSELDVDKKWIREVEDKIDWVFRDSIWRLRVEDEKIPLICQLVSSEISGTKLETVGEFSRPSVVAIGSIQRRECNQKSISDYYKWVIVGWMNLLYFLNLADCLFTLKKEVLNALDRYSDPLYKSYRFYFENNKEFVEMLLLDSYFILFVLTVKILKRPSSYTLTSITGKFARTPRTLNLFPDDTTKILDIIYNKDEIAPDLLILDNQIPFSMIEKLFKKLKSDKPLHEYALEFFETIHPRSTQGCMDQNSPTPPKFSHLLHLFHWSRVPQNKYIIPGSWPRHHIPNAVELRESATMLEKTTSGSSLDITFPGGRFKGIIRVLNIPELHFRDYSSLIFHNLVAFEMHSSNQGCCTMAFCALMRNLLQSEEDVKLLWRGRILVSSSMDKKKLVNLFECLSKLTENHQMPSDLSTICQQVQSYHNQYFVIRFIRFLLLWYFPNPLMTFSVFVAALLFVPTLLQTIYSMLSYIHR